MKNQQKSRNPIEITYNLNLKSNISHQKSYITIQTKAFPYKK